MHTQGNLEGFLVVVSVDEYNILEVQIASRTLAAVSFARRKQEEEEERIDKVLLTSQFISELHSQIYLML